ncbi:MAG: flagellar hook-associated protein FlgL [Alphaproteobacteria bacterium]|nr:flagellar hook-associated protein FlgL [Alphaproteobacteria bacterium]
MGGIIDIGQSFLSDLSAAISSTGADPNAIQELATQSLDQIVQILNTQIAGRYIFSGSATATTPVDLSTYTGGTTSPSISDSSYYQGNGYTQSVEISDGYSLAYGVTADNAAFEKIIRSLSLVKNDPSNTTALNEAYDLLNEGLDDLANLKARISQDAQTLDQSINDNLSDLNLIDSMISDLKEVDVAEVSVKLQELETQLSASYSVTTKLLNLKLSDYL